MNTIKIKLSSTSKKPYIYYRGQKWFGFKISKLPNRFGATEEESTLPIRSWINFNGLCFVSREDFKNLFGVYTIE